MEVAKKRLGQGSQTGLLTFLFLAFLAVTVAFRLFLVAPPEQRTAASLDGEFAIVWEAWRALERASGSDLAVPDTAVMQALDEMALAAVKDSSDLAENVAAYSRRPPSSVPDGLGDVWRAWRLLQTDNPDISPSLLAHAAIQGLIGKTSDRALRYLSEAEYQEAREFFGGDSYEGIGAYVGDVDGVTVILTPFLGGPAEAAGLKRGDRIISVESNSVDGLSLEEVVDLIKGPRGTNVTLGVQGPDELHVRTVIVTRDVVPGPSLYTQLLGEGEQAGQVGYIQLLRFHRTTGDEFQKILQSLLDRGIQGLILDMRGNPGGSLQAATEVTSELVSEGIVMYEVSNDGQRSDWSVLKRGTALDIPLIVLVNADTASAAEVVAGALRDHGRARIYGTQTYGKGSVHTFQELSDGSALYLTASRWYTPNGQEIEGLGIEPDVVVQLTLRDYMLGIDRPLVVAYQDLLELIDQSEPT